MVGFSVQAPDGRFVSCSGDKAALKPSVTPSEMIVVDGLDAVIIVPSVLGLVTLRNSSGKFLNLQADGSVTWGEVQQSFTAAALPNGKVAIRAPTAST